MPGLPGSGVIDLMLVAAPGSVDRAADRLVRLGFQRRDGRDAWLAGRTGLVGLVAWRGRPYAVRLAVLPDADPGIRTALHLRDMLRADPRLRRDYAAVKRRLASADGADPATYAAGTSSWIEATLARRGPDGTTPGCRGRRAARAASVFPGRRAGPCSGPGRLDPAARPSLRGGA